MAVVTVAIIASTFLDKDPNKSQLKHRFKAALAKPLTAAEKAIIAKNKKQVKKQEPSVLVANLTKSFGQVVNRFLPSTMLQNLERKLIMAGQRNLKVTDILAIKGALPFVAIIIAIMLFSPEGQISFSVAGKSLFWTIIMIVVAFFLPEIMLSQQITQRQTLLLKELPFSVDMIKICVEAGLDLEGAFARIIGKSKGPLVEELERVLYEVRMGKERTAALADLGKRVGLADLSSFVSVLIQAEKLGMSVGTVLEMQSSEMRIKQSQRAREKAAKIPVLMMLPMVMFILPAMFIVILGPAMIQIMAALSGSGGGM